MNRCEERVSAHALCSREIQTKVRIRMMCGYWFAGLPWLVMPVVMLLVVALAVVLVWALVRWLNRKPTLPAPHDAYPMANEPSALELLQQRYARGEIDTPTFENMRERLVASGARDDDR
jgi:uncharacterized membrane protein